MGCIRQVDQKTSIVWNPEAVDQSDRLHTVLERLFCPLARVMIAHGVTISVATELLKVALVEAVEVEAAKEGQVTDSKVSLKTGLHRKDVRRIRRREPVAKVRRSFESGCALAIAHWTADERFLNSRGEPKKLVTLPRSGRVPFRDLVHAAKLDLPPTTVLEELERAGCVSLNRNRTEVTLIRKAYLPEASSPAMLEAFEKNLSAHLSAASANLIEDDGPFFERAVHFNNLSSASIEQLNEMACDLMQAALETLNEAALKHQKRDSGKPGNTHRISAGAYVFAPGPKAEQTSTTKTTPEED